MNPAGMVDGIRDAVLRSSEELLRRTGFCPRPQVHMLAEDMTQPYIGYITTRDFRRGSDAAEAIRSLGLLPSVLCATRLVIAWEEADLRTALDLPGGPFASAIVTVEATFTGHTLVWHPFEIELGPPSEAGIPTVIPHWQPVLQYADPVLLDPVAGLLSVWRELRRDDIRQTATDLQRAGFTINWAAQPG